MQKHQDNNHSTFSSKISYHIIKFVFTPAHSIQHLQNDINLILLIPSFKGFQTENADLQVFRMERSTSPGDIAAKNIKAQVENMCVGDNSGFKCEYNVRCNCFPNSIK